MLNKSLPLMGPGSMILAAFNDCFVSRLLCARTHTMGGKYLKQLYLALGKKFLFAVSIFVCSVCSLRVVIESCFVARKITQVIQKYFHFFKHKLNKANLANTNRIAIMSFDLASIDIAAIPSFLYGLIAPPPISPLFQAGGPFEGYNEDLVFTAAFICLLGLIDLLIVRPFLHPKARYFALHFVANMISATAAFPDMKRGMTEDPKTVFSGPTQTMVANSAVAAIHLYHCIAFPLNAADIFHHVTFVLILCGAAIPGKWHGGIANNFGCFFLSGVPGGIDYLLLVLNYQGVVDRAFEKRWYTRINVWLRGPSMVIYTFLAWCTWINGNVQVPAVFLLVIVGLHIYNGLHYLEQAVETGAIFFYKQKLEKMGVKLPEKKEKTE